MDVTGNTTLLGQEPIPLDAGSLFILAVTLIVFCGPLFVLFPPFPPRRSDALEETHNKIGLAAAQSGLRDGKEDSKDKSSGTIRSLFIYPIKSCPGVEVTRAKVLPTGLELDRLFTLAQLKSPFPVSVDDAGGDAARAHHWEFITQRQFPRLATLDIEVWRPDLAKIKGFRDPAAGSSDEAFLVLRFPWSRTSGGGPAGIWAIAAAAWETFAAKCTRGWRARPEIELVLPMTFPSADEIARKGYARETVRVWGDEVHALNMGCELPEELRLYLGVSNKLSLFRIDPDRQREVHGCAPSREEAGYQPVVAFQDSYPVHIMNLASVRDVESKVAKDKDLQHLDPRRFRANIFVSGMPSYDEDDWKSVKFQPKEASQQVEHASFHVSCRTTRCKLPNVDPDTGARHPVEPDKTLRAQRAIDEGAPKKGCLGMQMTPLFDNMACPETYLEVGMSVEVLARGEHMYKK